MTFFARLAGGGTLALALCSPAFAQIYKDVGGTQALTTAQIPFPYTPLSPGQHNLAVTASTGLTIPTGARYATICASVAAVKYTTDGTTTPTSSIGMPLASGSCVSFSGPAGLANFRAISATGTLDVEYFQ